MFNELMKAKLICTCRTYVVCINSLYSIVLWPIKFTFKIHLYQKKHISLKLYSNLDCGVLQAVAREEEFKIILLCNRYCSVIGSM